MSITVFKIHNVLRAYDRLIKSKVDRTARKQEKHEGKQEVSVPKDRVTISEESRERLNQYATFDTKNEEQDA